MKISGVIPLRNAVKLGYPFEQAIRSLRPLCDEIVVLVDPLSEDNTLDSVRSLSPDVIVESPWDLTNHRGHTNCEISVQTSRACAAATGDWILSLQADELIHEAEIARLRESIELAEQLGVTGIELRRLYFFGSLVRLREDWTLWLLRLFKRGRWKPDIDGAMRFDPCDQAERRMQAEGARIYHYSRVGDPQRIADRIRNLDLFFHEPQAVRQGPLPPYDFDTLRKLDTYVIGHEPEVDGSACLTPFPLGSHPVAAPKLFGARR